MSSSPGSKAQWERDVLAPALDAAPERRSSFTTVSHRPIDRLYTAEDVGAIAYERDLGDPGDLPYTRGLHRDGYASRPWTMRQFAGYGTPEDTNARFKQLIAAGATGLSVAFDLPTLMGRDPDDAWSQGEVGKCGVSVASLADMETLFARIPLGTITTSMTINSPASMIFAMYLVVAEQQGADWRALSGTIQNDILKEYIAQKEYIFPPAPSMRLITDVFAFCARETPRWNTISVSGYHIREAGATALQELAFTLRDAVEYVEWGIAAGLAVETFVPRMSFFFNAHNDLFEEVAKFRAARRIWARVIAERFGVTDERCRTLRFHAQTAGVSLTAQQPYNNVVRTALQALAAVLGGASSLHTNALDEAMGLPTAEAAMLALRTQQILASETGIPGVVNPFGGSWFLERLTNDLEAGADRYFETIDRMGGMVAAIAAGFPQREIADAAYRSQRAIETGDALVVGVNAHVDAVPTTIPILQIGERAASVQRASVARVRERRDAARVQQALEALGAAAAGTANTMEIILECVRAYATVGEMCDTLRGVWGEYREEGGAV